MRRAQARLANPSGASGRPSATTSSSSAGNVVAFADASTAVGVPAAALAFLSELGGASGGAGDSASSSDSSSVGAAPSMLATDFQDVLAGLATTPSASSPAVAAALPPSQASPSYGASDAAAPSKPAAVSAELLQVLEAYAANSSPATPTAGAASG